MNKISRSGVAVILSLLCAHSSADITPGDIEEVVVVGSTSISVPQNLNCSYQKSPVRFLLLLQKSF